MATISKNVEAVSKTLSNFGEALATGDMTEQEVGTILDAAQVAITVGATGELAAIVKPWMDRKLLMAMGDREVVDKEALAAALRGS